MSHKNKSEYILVFVTRRADGDSCVFLCHAVKVAKIAFLKTNPLESF